MNVLHLFYSWPGGGVWSNILAEPLIVAATAVTVFLFRKPLNRLRMKHHEHLKEHISNEIRALEQRMTERGSHGSGS